MKKNSKVREIAEILRDRVDKKIFIPGVRLPSEYELADQLGVNRITVSKAVNLLIAEGWLTRGTSTRDGTYVRDVAVRSRGHIGLLFRRGTSYDYQLLAGAIQCASRSNYLLTVDLPEPENLFFSFGKMADNGILGVVIANFGSLRLDNMNFPCVYTDCQYGHNEQSSVVTDLYKAGYELASAILDAGHEEVVFAYDLPMSIMENSRTVGFLTRLREAGIRNPESRFCRVNKNAPHLALQRILALCPACTVLAGQSDDFVYRLAMELKQFDEEKFRRMTFAGFGNLPEIQAAFPMVSVEQYPYELGNASVELLIKILNGEKLPSPSPAIQPTLVNTHLLRKL